MIPSVRRCGLIVASIGLSTTLASAADMGKPVVVTKKNPNEVDEATKRRVSDSWSRCVVGSRYAQARSFVLNNDTSIWKTDVGARCMSNLPTRYDLALRPYTVLRGLLADALVRRDITKVDADFSLRMPSPLMPAKFDVIEEVLAHEMSAHPSPKLERMRNASAYIEDVGLCVAKRDPQAVFNLLRVAPLAIDEGPAFARLGPSLSLCVDNGVAFDVDQSTLRGAFAQALYRLANSPDVGRISK